MLSEKDEYGIPLDKPWRDVRMQDFEDNEFVGEPMNLMEWQAQLQTELGKERLKTRKLEAERDALVRAWYECPEDSVPEILDMAFQEIELATRKEIEDVTR